MSKDVTILFGPPGTGKTTRLVDEVAKALKAGVEPQRIAYMSFSRKAAMKAVEKATDPNGPLGRYGFNRENFTWFRTLHSAAYRQLGLRRHEVMATPHFRELGKAIGLVFQGVYDHRTEHAPLDLMSLGDRCLALYSRAKARGWSLEDEWRYANEWDLPWPVVRGFSQHLEAYKRDRGVVDFTDMIDMAQESLDVELMIIDEAQDLTPQQWAAARRFGANAKRVLIAGDDDQAIYSFSGATATPLMSVRGKRIVLPKSWRLPRNVKSIADRVITNIRQREVKKFEPRDADGYTTWIREPDDIDLREGRWLLLCRNRAQLSKLEAIARRQNVVYHSQGEWSNQADAVRAVVAYERIRKDRVITLADARLIQSYLHQLGIPEKMDKFHQWGDLTWPWAVDHRPNWMEALTLPTEDKEYIRGLRRREESLTEPGRVTISTVHGAKGGEEDNVMLLTDISGRVARGALASPDDEWRVVYVGVSRALEKLYMVQPSTRNFWSIAA